MSTLSALLKIKPDIDSSYYNGPGEYLFKVGRYTGSCSSPTWSSEKTIAITGPTHTPIPTATPSSFPSPTVTATPTKSPTPIATISNSPTISLSIRQSSTSTPYLEEITKAPDSSKSGDVLSAETIDVDSPFATSSSQIQMKPIIISLLFIAVGFGLLSGVFVWKKHRELVQPNE